MTVDEWRVLCRRDRAANRGAPKSILVLTAFRTAQLFRSRKGPVWRLSYLVVASWYKLLTEWVLGVEIPVATRIGAGLSLQHGIGVVINPHVVIGEDVMIRQSVTLGNRRSTDDCPVIGRGVELGAGATVIGAVTVGDYAKIGAGAVVVKDVPAHGVAYSPTIIESRPAPRQAPGRPGQQGSP
ncbi:hypothetical protein [Nocardioides sp. 1609]|uniref:serine acetyltransferase n=1 Tax=Nocardioides sp. 1609 TaxID=2508327 RepID=UPI001ADA28C9|nr:hypothetical protein [Nocardioides sp. 1609]